MGSSASPSGSMRRCGRDAAAAEDADALASSLLRDHPVTAPPPPRISMLANRWLLLLLLLWRREGAAAAEALETAVSCADWGCGAELPMEARALPV